MAVAAMRDVDPKTNTRRVMEQPSEQHETADRTSYRMDPELKVHDGITWADFPYTMGEHESIPCDYKVGERRCLLTTWAVASQFDDKKPTELSPRISSERLWHAGLGTPKPNWAGKSRPGRFLPNSLRHLMPVFEVISVRAERVQEISEDEAEAEGVQEDLGKPQPECDGQVNHYPDASFVRPFSVLWDSINAKRGFGWAKNPFVWVVTFKRLSP